LITIVIIRDCKSQLLCLLKALIGDANNFFILLLTILDHTQL